MLYKGVVGLMDDGLTYTFLKPEAMVYPRSARQLLKVRNGLRDRIAADSQW